MAFEYVEAAVPDQEERSADMFPTSCHSAPELTGPGRETISRISARWRFG